MMKARRVVGVAIAGVLLAGVIAVAVVMTGQSGANPDERLADTVAADVTYLDEARTTPIGSVITFDVSHPTSKTYEVNTDAEGELTVVYTASLSRGKVTVTVLDDGGTPVQEFQVASSGKFDYSLMPNASYSLRVDIGNAAGTIDLRWMEGAR